MKIIKVILLLFLVLKASIGFSINMSCCGEDLDQIECTSDDTEEEDKGCCSLICDCLCCGHVFTMDSNVELQFSAAGISSSSVISYVDNFSTRYTASLWQPPRLF